MNMLHPKMADNINSSLLMSAVEQSPSSIIITDKDKQIIYVNRKYTEVMGYQPEDILGKPPRIFYDTEQIDHKAMWSILLSGKEWRGSLLNKKKNGDSIWEQVAISPIENLTGEISHFLIIKEDITDQKQTEEKLEQTLAEATQMAINLEFLNAELKSTQSKMIQGEKMASIGQLAAGVAHEINNPMGFIASNLRSLNKYIDRITQYIEESKPIIETLDEEHQQQLKQMRKKVKLDYLLEDSKDLVDECLDGADRVRKIVQNLKTFSRVDQTGMQLTALNECIESTIAIVWNEIKYKAELTKDLGDIPQIECNSQELTQVFTNILVNAAQAIEKNGLITVTSRYEDPYIIIIITDNGCGMSEATQQKLFEPFFTTKPVGQGTGLGMSISYEIIKNHGGEISVNSTVGAGTQFTIKLPLTPPEDSEENNIFSFDNFPSSSI